jgi:murein DD-endopeptidase MepM/ murein hydrolase activator NlpD
MTASGKSKSSKPTKAKPKSKPERLRNSLSFNSIALYTFLVVVIALGAYVLYNATLASGSTELKSGLGSNYCLDDHGDGGSGTQIDTWPCNGSAAQHFSDVGGVLHLGTECLYPSGAGSKTRGRYVVEVSCSPTPWGGVWTESGGRFLNNHADSFGGTYCLDVAGAKAGGSVDIWPCNGGSNQSWSQTTYGGGSTPTPNPGVGGSYNNPLRVVEKTSGFQRERIDQGVDYGGSGPVYAIGPGKITNVYNSGWPDDVFISYKLTDSRISKYDIYVYVAEECTPNVSVGETVSDNTVLCHMFGASGGIETGFASTGGAGTAYAHACFDGSDSTWYGVAFNAVLEYLGAPGGVRSSTVTCSPPSGWPSASLF